MGFRFTSYLRRQCTVEAGIDARRSGGGLICVEAGVQVPSHSASPWAARSCGAALGTSRIGGC